ncbi:protein HGV2 isoform X3 [Phoenix dactylifera]|uniref:Protein HGV2 isoform X3 n=1 Tax=Phoenix dactylifera TaxID=42345 RepID=A0A8B7C6F1_PHODC|nr:protein HGV2 isoform X3 [Phoenix dactylifera]
MSSPDQAPALEPPEKEEKSLAADPVVPEAEKTPASEEQGNGPSVDGKGDSSSGGAAGSSGPEEQSAEKALALADEFFEEGSKAIEAGDFVDAVDCLSRALEIRVAHYGELAQECASAYYKYGCALLYKAQEEADPLGNVPKSSPTNLQKDRTTSGAENSGSSKASACDDKEDIPCGNNEESGEEGSDKDQEDVNEGTEGDGEDLAEADEEDSDLDLAWKMLDVARAIVEKRPEDSLEKVNILAALGEVSLEREDIETSLSDYQKALSIMECLVESDNRRIVELNFRICLVLELGSKIEEAIPYCEKAISLCKSRLQRLKENAVKTIDSAATSGDPMSDTDKSGNRSSETSSGLSNLEEEIDFLGGISTELEKKLEDLQQIKSNPRSVVSEVMKMFASKSTSGENNLPESVARSLSSSSSRMGIISGAGGFDSPTISTAATNGGVTHLGVIGRGVKRATVSSVVVEPSPKKLLLDSSTEKADSSTSEVVNSMAQDSETSSK